MEFQQELDAVFAKVDAWSTSKESTLQELKNFHQSFLEAKNYETIQLKQREKDASSAIERINHASVQNKSELDGIQNEVERLRQTTTLLPHELAELKKQLGAEKENLAEEEQELDVCQRSRDLNRLHLENGHGMYEKNLALRFERQQEGLLVVNMHNIDPLDHKRQFYFSFRVEDDSNLYNVVECIPAVEGLAGMVGELNRTNDLSAFVRRVRRAWVAGLAPKPAPPRGGRPA